MSKKTLQLEIIDITGKKVYEENIGDVTPAVHKIQWNGLSNSKAQIASGVYIYWVIFRNLKGKKNIQFRKLTIIK